MDLKKGDVIIELKDINFYYDFNKPTQTQVLKHINLEINKGDYVVFFGPSGCGKTTLTYLLGGIETEKDGSGEIFVDNKDIRKLSKDELASFRQKDIGIIFQQFNLIPSLNVIDNVALPMTFMGVNKKDRMIEAQKILVRLGLEKYAKRFPQELSGGQQQRVGIARALSNNPPIILADEPLGSLDSENAEHVLKFLKELNEVDGRTIIMVTHQAWSVRDATKIVYLKDGTILKVGESVETITSTEKPISPRLFKEVYKDLTKDEIRIKILANLLLRGFSSEEVKRFEFFLEERLSSKINSEIFLNFLNTPFHKEGVGLWKKKAEKISALTEDLLQHKQETNDIYLELEKNKETPLYEAVEKFISWILKEYNGKLKEPERKCLHTAVENYMRNVITLSEFNTVLNAPKSQSGVGLSMRSTQHISEKLEEALLVSTDKEIDFEYQSNTNTQQTEHKVQEPAKLDTFLAEDVKKAQQ